MRENMVNCALAGAIPVDASTTRWRRYSTSATQKLYMHNLIQETLEIV
jgi:hypothetical protein